MQRSIFLISRVTSCPSSAQETKWFKVMPKPRSSDGPLGFPTTHLTFSCILSPFPATGATAALLMPCPFPPQGLCSPRSLCLEHSSITCTNGSSLPSGLNSNFAFPGRPPLVRPPHLKHHPCHFLFLSPASIFFFLRTHYNLTSCVFYFLVFVNCLSHWCVSSTRASILHFILESIFSLSVSVSFPVCLSFSGSLLYNLSFTLLTIIIITIIAHRTGLVQSGQVECLWNDRVMDGITGAEQGTQLSIWW